LAGGVQAMSKNGRGILKMRRENGDSAENVTVYSQANK